jgi:hypothetical protein
VCLVRKEGNLYTDQATEWVTEESWFDFRLEKDIFSRTLAQDHRASSGQIPGQSM